MTTYRNQLPLSTMCVLELTKVVRLLAASDLTQEAVSSASQPCFEDNSC